MAQGTQATTTHHNGKESLYLRSEAFSQYPHFIENNSETEEHSWRRQEDGQKGHTIDYALVAAQKVMEEGFQR